MKSMASVMIGIVSFLPLGSNFGIYNIVYPTYTHPLSRILKTPPTKRVLTTRHNNPTPPSSSIL
jgi:hypothetical protein